MLSRYESHLSSIKLAVKEICRKVKSCHSYHELFFILEMLFFNKNVILTCNKFVIAIFKELIFLNFSVLIFSVSINIYDSH